MKKLFFIMVNILLVFFVPKLAFSTVAEWGGLYEWQGDGYKLNYYESGRYDSFDLYIEPDEIYSNNKALVNFNAVLFNEYVINKTNVTVGDFNFVSSYGILAGTDGSYCGPGCGTSTGVWAYTAPFVQFGASDFSSYISSSTITTTAPMLFETGKLYNIFLDTHSTLYMFIVHHLATDTYFIGTDPPPRIIDPNLDFNLNVGFRSNIQILGYDIRPVPEPSTLLLLGSGLVGLAGLGRRRFRK